MGVLAGREALGQAGGLGCALRGVELVLRGDERAGRLEGGLRGAALRQRAGERLVEADDLAEGRAQLLLRDLRAPGRGLGGA